MEPVFIPIAAFIMVGWIVWVGAKKEQARVDSIAALQSRTLDKFGSSPEFVEFLKSNEGKLYLNAFRALPKHPMRRMIGTISTGIVMVVLAFGLFAIGFLIPSEVPWEEPPMILGIISLFLGTGLIIAATVSYKLSKAMGLLNGNSETGTS
ncbi:MAG TPA: hypothetical protein VIL97_04985 [Thermoanaerobaculia bacterium]